jgi:hypothetical protein
LSIVIQVYLLTFLLGFGSGHFYLGDGGAVTFLVTDLVSIGIMVGGAVYMMSSALSVTSGSTEGLSGALTGYLIVGGGALIYSIARVWEIVDVFFAADKAKTAGTVTLVPGIMPRNDGIGLSLSILY